ncbi:hypothetical protein [Pseudomonas mangiferae]|uniref:Uncharacterized protein n=1 Tax=Pseudomonas mangiferae TaxID=2593654 RepID=A0A553GUS2_9PSED|nr:hypothetical protein [Pseudomonas mangiferae]TRX73235.1 hypothetical protein FM069_18860 [Pseudomonas mangiferae]
MAHPFPGTGLAFGAALLLGLAGCSSSPTCDEPMSGDHCREERLLYQNDMLQAKLLIASGDMENYELAQALLDRAATQDKTGEADFYRAVLMIRQGPQVDEVMKLLERSAERKHPYATALLYKIYSDPYLITEADPQQAEKYRKAYAGLDVAKSGYPSFDKAMALVNALLAAPQSSDAEDDDADEDEDPAP